MKNKFSEAGGYTINRKKSVAFIYINKISGRESTKKKYHLKLCPKKKKNPKNKPDQGGDRLICRGL